MTEKGGGLDISRMNEEELADFQQKNLGFVFQDYNLIDTLNIKENVMLPMALCGQKQRAACATAEYVLYFALTYLQFVRNIEAGGK